jgi:hypothetical protein
MAQRPAAARNIELEQELSARPDDRAAHRAYAEWLTSVGDSQGELITAQLAAEDEPKAARKLKLRAKKLLDEFIETRCVPEFPLLAHRFRAWNKDTNERSPDNVTNWSSSRIDWRRGLIRRVGMWEFPPEMFAQGLALLASPLSRFVEQLCLKKAAIEDLGVVGALSCLRVLELNGASAVSDLAPLRALTRVRYLDLRGTAVADLSPVAAFAALQYVNVERTPVSDLRPLGGLPQLWEVWCQNTKVSAAEAAALRERMGAHPLPPPETRRSGSMARRDVYGP